MPVANSFRLMFNSGMAYRKVVLATGEIYHIFNRAVARQPIFLTKTHYLRFLNLIQYYQFAESKMSYSSFKKLKISERERILYELKKNNQTQVEIIAFCIMPNHYHLLLKQTGDAGITTFIKKVQNAYAKYFNIKQNRPGALWGSQFQAVRVETDEQLIHLSRYIHLNPSTSFITKIEQLENYAWSSLAQYLGANLYEFVNQSLILSFFQNKEDYRKFVFDQSEHQRELGKIKHLLMEKK
jgi:putative transposase